MVAYDVKNNRFENATVVNDKIYVTGGFFNSHDSVEDSDSFDCYDPTDRLVGVNGNTAIQAI